MWVWNKGKRKKSPLNASHTTVCFMQFGLPVYVHGQADGYSGGTAEKGKTRVSPILFSSSLFFSKIPSVHSKNVYSSCYHLGISPSCIFNHCQFHCSGLVKQKQFVKTHILFIINFFSRSFTWKLFFLWPL